MILLDGVIDYILKEVNDDVHEVDEGDKTQINLLNGEMRASLGEVEDGRQGGGG